MSNYDFTGLMGRSSSIFRFCGPHFRSCFQQEALRHPQCLLLRLLHSLLRFPFQQFQSRTSPSPYPLPLFPRQCLLCLLSRFLLWCCQQPLCPSWSLPENHLCLLPNNSNSKSLLSLPPVPPFQTFTGDLSHLKTCSLLESISHGHRSVKKHHRSRRARTFAACFDAVYHFCIYLTLVILAFSSLFFSAPLIHRGLVVVSPTALSPTAVKSIEALFGKALADEEAAAAAAASAAVPYVRRCMCFARHLTRCFVCWLCSGENCALEAAMMRPDPDSIVCVVVLLCTAPRIVSLFCICFYMHKQCEMYYATVTSHHTFTKQTIFVKKCMTAKHKQLRATLPLNLDGLSV